MKKFFLHIFIFVALGLFFSCSDFLNTDDTVTANESTAYITLNLGSSARTVLPDVTTDDFTYLELKGTVEGGTEETLGSWESVAQMQQAVIPLSQGKWTFTLTARIRVSAYTRTTYESTIEKEIVLGENALSFELYLSYHGGGNGAFSITLSYAESQNADSVSYAIASLERYYYEDLVSGYEAMRLEPENNAVTFAVDSIKVDVFPYRAKITFYAEDGAVLATYREFVLVLYGKTSTATRTILIDNNANYEIRYELNDGNFAGGSLVPAVFNTKTPLTLTDAVEREHYTFAGWYTDENCTDGNEITTTRGREADLTVYAKWTPCVYTVTFETNGGSEIASQQVTYTQKATEPAAPEKQNTATKKYTFSGWCADSDCTTPFDFATPIESDTTLYAKWAETALCTVTFNTSGGSAVESQSVWTGEKVAEPTAPEKSPYDFMGWYTSSDGGSTLSGTSFAFDTAVTEDITLYAKWCITADASTVAEKIMAMTESGTVVVTGVLTTDDIRLVNAALKSLHNSSAGIQVSLDLSATTLTSLEDVTEYTWINNIDYSSQSFYKCISLKEIILPDTLTSIGKWAFYGCEGLRNITMNGVENIGADAFCTCSRLRTITIPDSVKTIGSYAFLKCQYLESITLGKGMTTISEGMFSGCTRLASITIPDNITTISSKAFENCTSLKNIVIPNSVTTIASEAFTSCTNLTDITIPSSVKTISSKVFNGCTQLANVTISDGVTSIENSAFYNCKSLKTLVIPDSVTTMASGALAGCSALETLTIPFVGGNANATEASEVTLFGYIFGINSYTGGVETKQYYKSNYQSYWTGEFGAAYYIPASLKTVIVTGGSLLTGAFCNCFVTNITLPPGITSIPSGALYQCKALASLTMYGNITSADKFSVNYCTNLETVYFEGTLEQWNRIVWSTERSGLNGDYSSPATIKKQITSLYIQGVLQ